MNFKTTSQQIVRAIGSSARALLDRHKVDSVIVHDSRFAHIPPMLAMPLICGHVKGALHCPDNLTIALMHNYADMPLMEQSLRYTGIERYEILNPVFKGDWRDSIKLTTLLNYLESGACQTEYLLYADSRDAFLRAEPSEAIALLQALNCDCLFSAESTCYGYECMRDVKAWAQQNAVQHGSYPLFINAGVFLGRTEFLRELLQEAMKYIVPTELTRADFRKHLFAGTLCKALPNYPSGVGSDQQIIRWLHPHFYPRMQCDYSGRLAALR